MKLYMLDTNIASYVIKGHPPQVRERLSTLPMQSVLISAVTEGELLYGRARRGNPEALSLVIREFLMRMEVAAWDSQVAKVYGELRAQCAAVGATLGALDMMIAAHAVALQATLVSNDRAFSQVPVRLQVEDWTTGIGSGAA